MIYYDMSWEEWFKRRRPFTSWFQEIEEMMREMEREMERMFERSMKEFEEMVPKELVREYRLPDGSVRREWGPFVYGYSITIGPDGKPVIREFGNVRPSLAGGRFSLKEEREPLVDIITTDDEVKVIIEMPGVNKDDIRLTATEKSLTINAQSAERKYSKKVELPEEVDPKSARSTYKNGILEVTFNKKESKQEGFTIKID